MATAEMQSISINGSYAAQQAQGYGIPEQNFVSHNASSSVSGDYGQQAAAPSGASAAANGGQDVSKEEVGWYFVEQYYTTLSKNPDRLYLFYNKRSQFLMGTEAEKVMTAVGQKAINQKIIDQNIKDCKVRVSNVDTQGSGQNIVIQVIGEISMDSVPQKKFTQTFVLAEQTNGYFVLNDMFRFLVDEEEEHEEQENQLEETSGTTAPATAATEAVSGHQESSEPRTLTASDDAAKLVDQGLEEAIVDEQGHTNGAALESAPATVHAEEAPVGATLAADETPETATHVVDAVRAEDLAEPELPKDPEPTRAPSPPQQAASSKSSAPKTWANLVAGNRVALPAAPSSSTQAQPAPAKSATAAAAASSAPVSVPAAAATGSTPAAASTPTAEDSDRPATPKSGGSEWQTAQRHDHGKKNQRPQGTVNPDQNRGYIKNVGEDVNFDELKGVMAKFGELHYFDINRGKRCAFVDWKEPKGYQQATAANPHRISNATLTVEERHVKPPGVVANSGNFRNNFRGGARGNFNEQRGGGRGGSTGRGRGGNTAASTSGGGSTSGSARGGRGGASGGATGSQAAA